MVEIQKNLPNSIQAGFYMTHSSNRERAAAQKAHADFLKAYGLSELEVPMLVLDLNPNPDPNPDPNPNPDQARLRTACCTSSSTA